MVEVIHIQPNITEEENEENLKRVIDVIEKIAQQINKAE